MYTPSIWSAPVRPGGSVRSTAAAATQEPRAAEPERVAQRRTGRRSVSICPSTVRIRTLAKPPPGVVAIVGDGVVILVGRAESRGARSRGGRRGRGGARRDVFKDSEIGVKVAEAVLSHRRSRRVRRRPGHRWRQRVGKRGGESRRRRLSPGAGGGCLRGEAVLVGVVVLGVGCVGMWLPSASESWCWWTSGVRASVRVGRCRTTGRSGGVGSRWRARAALV